VKPHSTAVSYHMLARLKLVASAKRYGLVWDMGEFGPSGKDLVDI
jgi:hypothetical protein